MVYKLLGMKNDSEIYTHYRAGKVTDLSYQELVKLLAMNIDNFSKHYIELELKQQDEMFEGSNIDPMPTPNQKISGLILPS